MNFFPMVVNQLQNPKVKNQKKNNGYTGKTNS